LSALQCRLFLATMDDVPEQMRSAIDDSLVECNRMIEQIRALQNRMTC
jgi:hypothetical protein